MKNSIFNVEVFFKFQKYKGVGFPYRDNLILINEISIGSIYLEI